MPCAAARRRVSRSCARRSIAIGEPGTRSRSCGMCGGVELTQRTQSLSAGIGLTRSARSTRSQTAGLFCWYCSHAEGAENAEPDCRPVCWYWSHAECAKYAEQGCWLCEPCVLCVEFHAVRGAGCPHEIPRPDSKRTTAKRRTSRPRFQRRSARRSDPTGLPESRVCPMKSRFSMEK